MARRSVIIVAGGSGTRMNQSLPKQFLTLRGAPIIVHGIRAFLQFDSEIQVIVVLPKAHFDKWEAIEREFFIGHQIHLAEGGVTRFQSVKSGLAKVEAELVAIHDAVRPLVSQESIAASFSAADQYGSGVAMVPLKDSIRRKQGDQTISEDRSHYMAVQTPQTFQLELLKKAFEQAESPLFTDDASVLEAAGYRIVTVAGNYENIKITTPEDLLIAEALL